MNGKERLHRVLELLTKGRNKEAMALLKEYLLDKKHEMD
jgi:hypothetical protein